MNNKPKYEIGYRVGNWTIINCSYSNWLGQFVYGLEAFGGRQQLKCGETSLDKVVSFINEKTT